MRAPESDRFTITAQPDRCGEQCRGDDQSDPQARAAQEPPWSELRQRDEMRIDGDAILVLEVESGRYESAEALDASGNRNAKC